jgi:solute:Na+ symporter, SSS family
MNAEPAAEIAGEIAALPDAWIVTGVAGAYLLASLVVGMWPGRKATDSAEGFVAGDRSLGLLVMFFITGATIFSAFAFLGGPGWAYSRGVAALYILGYGALGFAPFYFLGPRAARLGRRHGYVTQAEMVAGELRLPALAGMMALVSILAFVPYLALQMKGAGYVVATVTRGAVSEAGGAAIVYGVVLVYVLRSGVLGVGWTNTFQGVFMLLLAWGLGLYLPFRLHGGVAEMFAAIEQARPELLAAPGLTGAGEPWTLAQYSAAVVVSAIGFSFWPHLFMKAFTARDEATLRRTVVLYPTFQVFLVPLFLIGFCGVLFHSVPERPDQILPHMLMNLDLPALVVGLFCAGALAASMSSGDAMAHAAASIAVRDGWLRSRSASMAPAAERRLMRWVLVAVMILSYLVAMAYEGSLVVLLLSAYGAVVQFAPAVVAALYFPAVGGRAAIAGMVTGSVVTVLLIIWPQAQPIQLHPGLWGLAVNVAVLLAVSRSQPNASQL